MTAQEVVEAHSGAQYRVYMIGFAPGFAYLGGLPEQLHTSRRAEPRLATPAGSISIGGQQAAISPPLEAPSGWRLLGRTPVRSYDPDREEPFLFSPGDLVTFRPISESEYDSLAAAAAEGTRPDRSGTPRWLRRPFTSSKPGRPRPSRISGAPAIAGSEYRPPAPSTGSRWPLRTPSSATRRARRRSRWRWRAGNSTLPQTAAASPSPEPTCRARSMARGGHLPNGGTGVGIGCESARRARACAPISPSPEASTFRRRSAAAPRMSGQGWAASADEQSRAAIGCRCARRRVSARPPACFL